MSHTQVVYKWHAPHVRLVQFVQESCLLNENRTYAVLLLYFENTVLVYRSIVGGEYLAVCAGRYVILDPIYFVKLLSRG